MRKPNHELAEFVDQLDDAIRTFGWEMTIEHVSRARNTVYAVVELPDPDHRARLRISSHRSHAYEPGFYRTKKGVRMALQVITNAPETWAQTLRYLAADARRHRVPI